MARDVKTTYGLSDAETLVLELMTKGLSDQEVATWLAFTPDTVIEHVDGILRKTGARSRTEAAVKAIKDNLI
jgi:DNA-binding NarL/FixJ family response regulator